MKKIALIGLLILFGVSFRAQTTDTVNVKIVGSESVNTQVDSAVSETDAGISKIFTPAKIILSLIVFVVGLILIRLITYILNSLSERSINYRITIKGVIPVIRIVGWLLILLIIVVGIFSPPIATVLLITGSLGIAVGFAAQDLLKNIFGGIMILFDRPFQVGDKIQIGGYYGEVLSVGLRSIRLVTPDDSVVSVPNGEIMSHSISNANSGEAFCQVISEIYLPSYINTDKTREIAVKAAQVSKYIYLNKPVVVIFKNEIFQNRSVLKMRLKAYVLDIRYEFSFLSEMTEVTIKELLKQKIISKEELNGLTVNETSK